MNVFQLVQNRLDLVWAIVLYKSFYYIYILFIVRTPQLRTTEEAIGRHHTARHEVSPIKERAYC